jgi:aryl-alcohol dehydrogenase-like predicted oxidoreductase
MKYNMLGRTGLYVSEICFGTMTFGGKGRFKNVGQVDQQGSDEMVKAALDAGVNFFDTANVYSEGESEKQLGQALKNIGAARHDVVIATKVRGRMGPGANSVGLARGHIMDAVEGSLKRLQTDHIDLYQIHGFDALTPLEETRGALDNLVKRGMVRYIGCSNLMAWHIAKALGISAAHGWSRFETVQAYYTIASRDLEREIVPLVEAEKMGVMVWSPLAGGLLSGKFKRDQAGPNNARRSAGFDFPPVDKNHTFDVIDAMRPIAERHNVSVARVALAWLLQKKGVMAVIVGAKTEEQLRDNLGASNLTLETSELSALEEVSKLRPEYPAWMVEFQGQGRVPEAK